MKGRIIDMSTNITERHKADLEALRDPSYDNFALFSCWCNDVPTSVIVAITEDNGEYHITPLFVAVTDDMRLVDHDGVEPEG